MLEAVYPPFFCWPSSSSGGGGGRAISSIVATGSNLAEIREEVREPCRVMDFLFRVLLRSSRKLGWIDMLALGDVGGICELKEDTGIC